jgi:hypothetical protein
MILLLLPSLKANPTHRNWTVYLLLHFGKFAFYADELKLQCGKQGKASKLTPKINSMKGP